MTLVYVFLLVLIRLSGKRTVAESSVFDVVISQAIGDLPDDVVWGEVPLSQGLVAIATLVLLHMLVTALAARIRWIDRLVRPGPTLGGAARADRRPLYGLAP